MSFVDLASLALHRRNEMEDRINVFSCKCDQAINEINKLKMQAQNFVQELNCDPGQLKERFLNCMKRLDEFNYLMTDFNLSVNMLESNNTADVTPVQDTSITTPTPSPGAPYNLIDALSEPSPSTSKTCPNQCPSEKPISNKVPKHEQLLIAFSSTSSSSESVPQVKIKNMEKEVQCKIVEDTNSPKDITEGCNLPAQTVLQIDHEYLAKILNVDGCSFWVITEDPAEVEQLINEMTVYYKNNVMELSQDQIRSLNYCACYDHVHDCFYRGLFIRISQYNSNCAEVFFVDTGEVQVTPVINLQPLAQRFCKKPPYARCCHLAGIEINNSIIKDLPEKLEEFLGQYVNLPCKIEIDDNTSESLGVFVVEPTGNVINLMLIERGLASAITNANTIENRLLRGPPRRAASHFNMSDCPEYEDPVEAVTGYHNRDEADICKHYTGGPNKTCFKGARCQKKHILKHPDGWTLDRVSVAGKCEAAPLPAPGTWLRVHVTHVAHYDRFYVQIVKPEHQEEVRAFGVVLPPSSLQGLVRDMNSLATRLAYKPLKIAPAPGELVAALYPLDDQWYRARVLSTERVDQNVEVMYIDYGNVVWVKEDEVRELDGRYWALDAQAVCCLLAGVRSRSSCSRQWAAARARLQQLILERALNAYVVARDYDEITVELFDEDGASIGEKMAETKLVELVEFKVEDDTAVKQKIVAG